MCVLVLELVQKRIVGGKGGGEERPPKSKHISALNGFFVLCHTWENILHNQIILQKHICSDAFPFT